MEIKIRLVKLGRTQRELCEELKNRGFKNLVPPTLSAIITGKLTTPMAYRVRNVASQILTEWEEEQGVK